MPRQELHSSDIKIDQKPDLVGDILDRAPEVVRADASMANKDYLDELAFNDEPVTIRLEPNSGENAPTTIPIWVNGKGCEIYENGRWIECAYIPIGRVIVVKRKYLEVLVRAKLDTVRTDIDNPESENPGNRIKRFTSAVSSFSIIEDRNPCGGAWLTELRRRNM